MSIDTMWLEGKRPVPGLDQLGIRATSIRMYSHLVPGITNVTERARYFSIHPYAIDIWARRSATTDRAKFQQLVRRIECLIAVGEKIRVRSSNEESPGIVGTIRIGRWLRDQPHPLPDDLPIAIAELQEEYFENRWGGFGQYYSGPEQELGIIAWKDNLPRLADPLGPLLAARFSRAADRCRLPDLLEDQVLTAAQLLRVGEEVGFHRLEPDERAVLREILFDDSNRYGESGLRRRKTLLLILHIARHNPGGLSDPAWQVLEAALHKRVAPSAAFDCPQDLAGHVELWRIYALHEFLAFALEVILAVAVEELADMEGEGIARSLANLANRTGDLLPQAMGTMTLGDICMRAASTMTVPALDPTADEYEEGTLRRQAIVALRRGDHQAALMSALYLVGRTVERIQDLRSAYQPLLADGLVVDSQRIGLDDVRRYVTANTEVALRRATFDLTRLVVNTHLRVATAKLAYNDDFTYKLVYESGRLRKVRNVDPAFSSPRLFQAAQMLADLGLLVRDGGTLRISDEGAGALASYGFS